MLRDNRVGSSHQCLENPRPAGAELSLTEDVTSPFQAEPRQKGVPGSPESLAQGMFPKGFPMNPGELTISARKSGKTVAKGDRRRPRTDGGAVLRPHST
jgi:hypothetical protein